MPAGAASKLRHRPSRRQCPGRHDCARFGPSGPRQRGGQPAWAGFTGLARSLSSGRGAGGRLLAGLATMPW